MRMPELLGAIRLGLNGANAAMTLFLEAYELAMTDKADEAEAKLKEARRRFDDAVANWENA